MHKNSKNEPLSCFKEKQNWTLKQQQQKKLHGMSPDLPFSRAMTISRSDKPMMKRFKFRFRIVMHLKRSPDCLNIVNHHVYPSGNCFLPWRHRHISLWHRHWAQIVKEWIGKQKASFPLVDWPLCWKRHTDWSQSDFSNNSVFFLFSIF